MFVVDAGSALEKKTRQKQKGIFIPSPGIWHMRTLPFLVLGSIAVFLFCWQKPERNATTPQIGNHGTADSHAPKPTRGHRNPASSQGFFVHRTRSSCGMAHGARRAVSAISHINTHTLNHSLTDSLKPLTHSHTHVATPRRGRALRGVLGIFGRFGRTPFTNHHPPPRRHRRAPTTPRPSCSRILNTTTAMGLMRPSCLRLLETTTAMRLIRQHLPPGRWAN